LFETWSNFRLQSKMMLETAMRFAGHESACETDRAENILSIVKNLQRFVAPNHQLIANLKLKLLEEITSDKFEESAKPEILEKGFSACKDLMLICKAIAPGQSRLLGKLKKERMICLM
jgi:hypothetical protein